RLGTNPGLHLTPAAFRLCDYYGSPAAGAGEPVARSEAPSQDNHEREFLRSAQEGDAVSTWQILYLGPYAAFPTDAKSLPGEKGGKPLGWRNFSCHLEESYPVESEGRAYYLPCGAKGKLPKPAPREMYFAGSKAFPWQPDLAGVKPKDQIAWFKREY